MLIAVAAVTVSGCYTLSPRAGVTISTRGRVRYDLDATLAVPLSTKSRENQAGLLYFPALTTRVTYRPDTQSFGFGESTGIGGEGFLGPVGFMGLASFGGLMDTGPGRSQHFGRLFFRVDFGLDYVVSGANWRWTTLSREGFPSWESPEKEYHHMLGLNLGYEYLVGEDRAPTEHNFSLYAAYRVIFISKELQTPH